MRNDGRWAAEKVLCMIHRSTFRNRQSFFWSNFETRSWCRKERRLERCKARGKAFPFRFILFAHSLFMARITRRSHPFTAMGRKAAKLFYIAPVSPLFNFCISCNWKKRIAWRREESEHLKIVERVFETLQFVCDICNQLAAGKKRKDFFQFQSSIDKLKTVWMGSEFESHWLRANAQWKEAKKFSVRILKFCDRHGTFASSIIALKWLAFRNEVIQYVTL